MTHGQPHIDHRRKPAIGVLLVNLGSPSAPTKTALRKYLKQFLSDQRVVEIPRLLWWPILHGILLNTRPAKSAKLYQSIWTDQGSPLACHTQAQTTAVASSLTEQLSEHKLIVRYAMRYGEPSIKNTLAELMAEGAEQILVLPLYPQYAGSTTGSTFDALSDALQKIRWVPELRFVNHYHDNPHYIAACAARIREHWAAHGKAEQLVLSFHGLPRLHIDRGDPYFYQCQTTVRLLAENLDLSDSDYLLSFQSRFGRAQWLQPYTDKTLQQLATQGVKSVDVFCPGFASDCLETLEEIAVENRQYFLDAGGERYNYIPALNHHPKHIAALTSIILDNTNNWRNQPVRDVTRTQNEHY